MDRRKCQQEGRGEFFKGRARVCIDGKLRKEEDPTENKFTVEDALTFRQKFNLVPLYFTGGKHEGRLLLGTDGDKKPKWGFIDTSGRIIIEPQYDYVRSFDKGQAVAVQGRDWGVIDTENNVVIDFKYASVSSYYGRWKISERNKGAIIFNQRGWQIVGPQYEGSGQFNEGLCKVKRDGKWGFIDETGKEVIPCKYSEVKDFSEGLAAVKYQKQWIFLDTAGKTAMDLSKLSFSVLKVGVFKDSLCW